MDDSVADELTNQEGRARIAAETGELTWPELQRHFARGVLVKLGRGLNLVDVAYAFQQDDRAQVEEWMHDERVAKASTEDALTWQSSNPMFRVVVVAPWVLVQELDAQQE